MAFLKFKKKEPLSYVEAHNKAVNRYQKSSFFLVWIGVVNLLSAIIGAFQTIGDAWPSSNYSMSLSVQLYLDAVLTVNLGSPWAAILIVVTSATIGAVFAILGAFASKGYKIPLFVGTILYLADASLIFYLFDQSGSLLYHSGVLQEDDLGWTAYAFMIATHVVILFFLVVAIFYYFQVLTIEKTHRGASKVVFTPKDETVVIAENKSKKEKDTSYEEKKNE